MRRKLKWISHFRMSIRSMLQVLMVTSTASICTDRLRHRKLARKAPKLYHGMFRVFSDKRSGSKTMRKCKKWDSCSQLRHLRNLWQVITTKRTSEGRVFPIKELRHLCQWTSLRTMTSHPWLWIHPLALENKPRLGICPLLKHQGKQFNTQATWKTNPWMILCRTMRRVSDRQL